MSVCTCVCTCMCGEIHSHYISIIKNDFIKHKLLPLKDSESFFLPPVLPYNLPGPFFSLQVGSISRISSHWGNSWNGSALKCRQQQKKMTLLFDCQGYKWTQCLLISFRSAIWGGKKIIQINEVAAIVTLIWKEAARLLSARGANIGQVWGNNTRGLGGGGT